MSRLRSSILNSNVRAIARSSSVHVGKRLLRGHSPLENQNGRWMFMFSCTLCSTTAAVFRVIMIGCATLSSARKVATAWPRHLAGAFQRFGAAHTQQVGPHPICWVWPNLLGRTQPKFSSCSCRSQLVIPAWRRDRPPLLPRQASRPAMKSSKLYTLRPSCTLTEHAVPATPSQLRCTHRGAGVPLASSHS